MSNRSKHCYSIISSARRREFVTAVRWQPDIATHAQQPALPVIGIVNAPSAVGAALLWLNLATP